jgi:hypothetical protein
MPGLSLDAVEAAYLRTRRYIERDQEDALEFLSDPAWEGLERDRSIVDAAFFLLIFGQIEDRINALARGRLSTRQQSSLRTLKFEKRLALAVPNNTALKSVIEGWYEDRSDAAHGRSVASAYDIPAMLGRAREIEAQLVAAGAVP